MHTHRSACLSLVFVFAASIGDRSTTSIGSSLGAATATGVEPGAAGRDAILVHGVTVSCETFGREWGTDRFAESLDELKLLGVNWVAIHPYASIERDGTITARRLDPAHPPEWITRPIREAHARGQSILVIPHIAYWGSPWKWRGEIEFPEQAARERFFATYRAFLENVAVCAAGADAFSIGNELERLVVHEDEWRALIAALRVKSGAKLTYAADWSGYERVPFWDALDAIGIDAYFPLCQSDDPSEEHLRAGWHAVFEPLEQLHRRTGKPVVFTELGYNCSLDAAKTPWTYAQAPKSERDRAEVLQTRCLRVALEEIGAQSEWLRGAFVWKWFVGSGRGETFLAKTPAMQSAIRSVWGRDSK